MDNNYLTSQLPLLCSADSSKIQILLDKLYKTKRKPSFSISLKMKDGKIIKVHPNSFYQGDNWNLGENGFINDIFVTSFLDKAGLNSMFISMEKEYFMIELLGINKKYKIM